ncbi:MAG: hypothetical protein VX777_05215 [Chlamydiota bacterium]|nr:hypothetical protein [Chlamydiota bacterium]
MVNSLTTFNNSCNTASVSDGKPYSNDRSTDTFQNSETNEYATSALMIATQNGHTDIVKKLVLEGANVTLNDNDKHSQKLYVDTLKKIITAAAKVNRKTK